ncbi:rhophilin-2-B-like [Artemia franciscana]|uniref:rhophilin-2-B-like n=1 Tax=Artemia franciscana TaxID=6661 RepID=UPI0032DABCFA
MITAQDEVGLDDGNFVYFRRVKGSDPRGATCRSKLQTKRTKINLEINKELRLRDGAENLYRATNNKKLRETVALELSFLNSNLQLLKEELAQLNSNIEVYQAPTTGNDHNNALPMIPLGLKETKEVLLREPFMEFLQDHYGEDSNDYDDCIDELCDLRQAMRTPSRDASGVSLLYEYYNQLYFVERRFFPSDRSLGVFFEWYDSLTGIPSAQRTVAFEKACVLFNLGALHTQIGVRQDRRTGPGLDAAADSFLRAAAIFKYILENFTNAPSMDLAAEMLEALVLLMLAQARECLFEKLSLYGANNNANTPDRSRKRERRNRGMTEYSVDRSETNDDFLNNDEDDFVASFESAQEAAEVSDSYDRVSQAFDVDLIKEYVPAPWLTLVRVKSEHYRALAHSQTGKTLLLYKGELGPLVKETLGYMYAGSPTEFTTVDIRIPKNFEEKRILALAHLRKASETHEESQRLQRMCRELKRREQLALILRNVYLEAMDTLADAQEVAEPLDIDLDPPSIMPATKFQLTLAPPDFAQYPVSDLFRRLGPVSLFSARHRWSKPKLCKLNKLSDQGFGFSVKGEGPVVIAGVDGGSLADLGGVCEGDVIIGIGEADTRWSSHEDVVNRIKSSGDVLTLRLVTPLDRTGYFRTDTLPNNKGRKPLANQPTKYDFSCSKTSTTSSSSGVSSSGSRNLCSPTSSSTSSYKPRAKSEDRSKNSRYSDSTLDRSADSTLSSRLKMTWTLFRKGKKTERNLGQSKAYSGGLYKSSITLR